MISKETLNFIDKFSSIKKEEDEKKILEYAKSNEGLTWEIDEENLIVITMRGHNYLFDREGYAELKKLWNDRVLSVSNEGYLCVDGSYVHHLLKLKEVQQLAKELGCPEKDIHVHHKNISNPEENKFDNRLDNLEVLHKDKHAQKHGFLTWELYQRDREKRRIGQNL